MNTISERRPPLAASHARHDLGQGLRAALDLQIAPEELSSVGGQAAIDRLAQRPHARDHTDPEREAGQHDPEPAHPGPQFPSGKTEGEDHAKDPAGMPGATP